MNRKQRRELRKDKNVIKELYSIINKYLPELLDKLKFYKISIENLNMKNKFMH